MRCHYLSDLHLESQDFRWTLPKGEILIIAGDLCHARTLDPTAKDLYAVKQRDRVLRFADAARRSFEHVLMVAGNHDHYDGVFEDTVGLLRRHLPGFTVLDDVAVEIGGVSFFGTTLWSDFEGRDEAAMEKARRGVGEFFFVKTRRVADDGSFKLEKFRPRDALAAFDRALAALGRHLDEAGTRQTIVISHHAPSRNGLNPRSGGNGLDGAYASDLDSLIAGFSRVPVWIHGHTHVRTTYRIGETLICANCRGFDARDPMARSFRPTVYFDC